MNKDSADNSKKLNHEEDLIMLLDALQMKIKKNKSELEKLKPLEGLEDNNNFHKESQSDLIIQINELQNVIIQKSNDYKLLSFEYENIKREMDLTLNSLKEYKKLTFEQNKEILRAMKIIKRKKFIY